VVASKAQGLSKLALGAAVQLLPAISTTKPLQYAFQQANRSTPPPVDAVIVYLHLTI
jgi:hypothetical protein